MLTDEGLETIHIDSHAMGAAPTVPCSPPFLYPAVDRKVCRFRQVEPVVEATVVCRWERDHKFAGFLLQVLRR